MTCVLNGTIAIAAAVGGYSAEKEMTMGDFFTFAPTAQGGIFTFRLSCATISKDDRRQHDDRLHRT
jgi:hypothetical protein